MSNMYVLLVHGTWAGAGRWTHDGSPFRHRLEQGLKELGYNTRFETYPWNGQNRWRARKTVSAKIGEHLDQAISERDGQWEFLVVAHSHAGNIATEAVRKKLCEDRNLPIRGIACLNTPFLTHEVRGASPYLLVWLFVLLVLGSTLWAIGGSDGSIHLPSHLAAIVGYPSTPIEGINLIATLSFIAVVVAGLLFLSRRIQKHQQAFPWEPRPNVLCLSCPDDEAITFLGLGEGIANLPQLLLHPLALALAAITALSLLYRSGDLSWCGQDAQCWYIQFASVSVMFVLWIGIALLCGILGACFLALMFGLSLGLAVETLVSRVLVSYTPLRPAQAFFRGINELPLKCGSPLQLFHSGIYKSPQTVREICEWVSKHTGDNVDRAA